MSSRKALIKKTEDALRAYFNEQSWDEPGYAATDAAPRLLDAMLPQITEARQMLGVPERSILTVEVQAGARALRWDGSFLHGDLRADRMPQRPAEVIERYGPLTVVWMP